MKTRFMYSNIEHSVQEDKQCSVKTDKPFDFALTKCVYLYIFFFFIRL